MAEPGHVTAEVGRGLWLYFKAFLLGFPLCTQAARTFAGNKIRSRLCWVVSAHGLLLLFKALKCLEVDYLQSFSLPRAAHMWRLSIYLP